MSRVAKIPVEIAKGVDAKIEGDTITIKGPKGTLTQKLSPRVEVKLEDGKVTFKPVDDSKESSAMSGTMRALVNSMNKGVSEGFTKKLTLIGVGYRAQAQGNKLTLNLGYSHPIVYELPQGVTAQTPTPTEINVSGANKQQVGQVAAEIRAFRSPEPYKGKGVRYADETVVIKETKKK